MGNAVGSGTCAWVARFGGMGSGGSFFCEISDGPEPPSPPSPPASRRTDSPRETPLPSSPRKSPVSRDFPSTPLPGTSALAVINSSCPSWCSSTIFPGSPRPSFLNISPVSFCAGRFASCCCFSCDSLASRSVRCFNPTLSTLTRVLIPGIAGKDIPSENFFESFFLGKTDFDPFLAAATSGAVLTNKVTKI